MTKKCLNCDLIFVVSKYPSKQGKKYCSDVCAGKHTANLRGDLQRDRGKGLTYRKYRGRHEHRVVMETILGRPLTSSEIVHHKDHNRRNNDPSNLEVLTRAEHSSLHSRLRLVCMVDGCNHKHLGRGFCSKHYTTYKRYKKVIVDGVSYTPFKSTKRNGKQKCQN